MTHSLHGAEFFWRSFGSQLHNGTRKFITAFTKDRHLPLSWATSIQSRPPSHFLKIHLYIIFPFTPWHSKWNFPSDFSTKPLYAPLLSTVHATCPAYLILLDFITTIIFGEEYRSYSSSLCSFLNSPVTWSLLGPNNLLSSAPYSQTPSDYVPPAMWGTMFHTHTKQQAKL